MILWGNSWADPEEQGVKRGPMGVQVQLPPEGREPWAALRVAWAATPGLQLAPGSQNGVETSGYLEHAGFKPESTSP